MAPAVSYFLTLIKVKFSFGLSFVYNDFRIYFESSGINDCEMEHLLVLQPEVRLVKYHFGI